MKDFASSSQGYELDLVENKKPWAFGFLGFLFFFKGRQVRDLFKSVFLKHNIQ